MRHFNCGWNINDDQLERAWVTVQMKFASEKGYLGCVRFLESTLRPRTLRRSP